MSLPRHGDINRTGWMRRTGRLNAVSVKRRKTQVQRRKMLDAYRSDICCASELLPHIDCRGALDPHEPLTRARGGSITDPDNLAWLCRAHHDHIHDHPDEGHRVGLLKHSWDRQQFANELVSAEATASVRRDVWCDKCCFAYADVLLALDGDCGYGLCAEGHPVELTFEEGDLP